jgi:F-type H+-transporting ATPase subunit gamma
MPSARKLDKRRKSIRNIRKITRTMELIATARFRRAMDRAMAATAYTQRITQIVADVARTGVEISHPLLQPRPATKSAVVLMLTANRGLCGGYNAGILRLGYPAFRSLGQKVNQVRLQVSGKRGISAMKFRGIALDQAYTQFDDQPKYAEVELLADRFLEAFAAGSLDRLDVVYTRFISSSKQQAVVETLLPLDSLVDQEELYEADRRRQTGPRYEFLPSAGSILAELVPASFKVRLFKCFLDAAVSEHIARRVAMKAATDNASDIIKRLSRTYNRARQSQITKEIMDIIGGAEALND